MKLSEILAKYGKPKRVILNGSMQKFDDVFEKNDMDMDFEQTEISTPGYSHSGTLYDSPYEAIRFFNRNNKVQFDVEKKGVKKMKNDVKFAKSVLVKSCDMITKSIRKSETSLEPGAPEMELVPEHEDEVEAGLPAVVKAKGTVKADIETAIIDGKKKYIVFLKDGGRYTQDSEPLNSLSNAKDYIRESGYTLENIKDKFSKSTVQKGFGYDIDTAVSRAKELSLSQNRPFHVYQVGHQEDDFIVTHKEQPVGVWIGTYEKGKGKQKSVAKSSVQKGLVGKRVQVTTGDYRGKVGAVIREYTVQFAEVKLGRFSGGTEITVPVNNLKEIPNVDVRASMGVAKAMKGLQEAFIGMVTKSVVNKGLVGKLVIVMSGRHKGKTGVVTGEYRSSVVVAGKIKMGYKYCTIKTPTGEISVKSDELMPMISQKSVVAKGSIFDVGSKAYFKYTRELPDSMKEYDGNEVTVTEVKYNGMYQIDFGGNEGEASVFPKNLERPKY